MNDAAMALYSREAPTCTGEDEEEGIYIHIF